MRGVIGPGWPEDPRELAVAVRQQEQIVSLARVPSECDEIADSIPLPNYDPRTISFAECCAIARGALRDETAVVVDNVAHALFDRVLQARHELAHEGEEDGNA